MRATKNEIESRFPVGTRVKRSHPVRQTTLGFFLLGSDADHYPLLQPSDLLPLLGAPGVGINAQDRRDARLILLGVGIQIPLVGAADGRDGRRVAGGGRAVAHHDGGSGGGGGGAVVLPCLLEHHRVRALAVLSGDGGPEARPVAAVDGMQAAHVDRRRRLLLLLMVVVL